jgi:predicted RNase H-like nuclease
LSLERKGFVHAPTITPQQPGRYQIEVFPHPATINLFGLDRILKYKKGKIAQRQAELKKLQQYIVNKLPKIIPSLSFSDSSSLPLIPASVTGSQLKGIEDCLDSLICAYVAAYWWYWGKERNWVLGDATTGYIIVPAPQEPENMAQ